MPTLQTSTTPRSTDSTADTTATDQTANDDPYRQQRVEWYRRILMLDHEPSEEEWMSCGAAVGVGEEDF
jgi:hypothetical protein